MITRDLAASVGRTEAAAMRRAERSVRDWWRRIDPVDGVPAVRAVSAERRASAGLNGWIVVIETDFGRLRRRRRRRSR